MQVIFVGVGFRGFSLGIHGFGFGAPSSGRRFRSFEFGAQCFGQMFDHDLREGEYTLGGGGEMTQ